MDVQFFLSVLIGFGFLVVFLFGLDIYHLTKKSKEEKGVMSLKFSEKFLEELEKTINQEIKSTISNNSQKINDRITQSYEKQLTIIFQEVENKMNNWAESIKDRFLKFSNACSLIEKSIAEQAKKTTEELARNLDKKIDQAYQETTQLINQTMNQTEQNIENYKKEKLKEIDQKIYQIIEEVAKQTIGKSIDISLHEELVIQALEKAKKQNFL